MANKELDKLRGMSVSDLNKSLETIYKEQFEDNLKLKTGQLNETCLLYTSPSPRDTDLSRMPSSA